MIAWLAANPLSSALGIALAASLAFGGWQCSQKNEARTDAAEARTALAEYEASIAKEREVFERQARATEQRHAADMQRIGQEAETREKEAGENAYNRAVADVRAGRLRNVWTCPAAARVSEAVGPSGQADESPDDRGEAIGRVLRIAAECDAQVIGLQEVIRRDRK